MNPYYNYDYNIYNTYIHYSGGYHPTFQQYQQFVHYLNNQQIIQNQMHMHLQAPQIQSSRINREERLSYCIKGMNCKDIKCNDYHHPSKDLDILNASKK
jgi:hypothetical protein